MIKVVQEALKKDSMFIIHSLAGLICTLVYGSLCTRFSNRQMEEGIEGGERREGKKERGEIF